MPKIKMSKTGEEIEVGVETAGHMISGGYATSAEPPVRKIRTKPMPTIGTGDLSTDLAGMSKAELVDLAYERGVDQSGTKAELIERLGG